MNSKYHNYKRDESSCSRARAYLEDQKQQNEKSLESKKKKEISQQIDELKIKKLHLQKSAEELENSANILAEQAEKKECLNFIIQSNSFRRSAKEKYKEVIEIDKQIKDMTQEIKKIN